MGIRQSLTLVAAMVAVLLALPGVAAASAAPTLDDPAMPSGSVAVSLAVIDGPAEGVTGDATVELVCSEPTDTALTSALSFAGVPTATSSISGVPLGVACTAVVVDLPLPPSGYAWGTAVDSDPVTIESSGGDEAATLSVPLIRLDGDLAIALGIIGAPTGGLTFDDQYTVDCGAAFKQTRVIPLVGAHSGAVSFDGIPDGSVCTVTALSTLAGLTTATLSPATVTVDTGSTVIIEARRTASAGGARVADVSVSLFGGPAAGITGSMTVGLECDSGDYLALLTFTGATTARVTVPGIPAGAVCAARAQSLPPVPAGYSWFGASPVDSTLVTIGMDPSTLVELFGRLAQVPIVPAPSSGTTGTSLTPPSSSSAFPTPVAPAVVPDTPPFRPVEAPTLAITGDPVPTASQDATADSALSPAAAVLAAIGLALVFLGLVAGVVALRITARHRRVRLAYT